jgi:EAL domain-containing protein (putative c-di-GMP-specific phosphodiesterase class I)
MVDNVSSLNTVRAVATLAAGLGVTATAGGMESQEQLNAIRAEGCNEMQGFLLRKPISLKRSSNGSFPGWLSLLRPASLLPNLPQPRDWIRDPVS